VNRILGSLKKEEDHLVLHVEGKVNEYYHGLSLDEIKRYLETMGIGDYLEIRWHKFECENEVLAILQYIRNIYGYTPVIMKFDCDTAPTMMRDLERFNADEIYTEIQIYP
jgi:hypothetical protein